MFNMKNILQKTIQQQYKKLQHTKTKYILLLQHVIHFIISKYNSRLA